MSEKAQALFGNPVPVALDSIRVSFSKGELITTIAERYEAELHRLAGPKVPESSIPTAEELSRYICALVKQRIMAASNIKPDQSWSFLKKVIRVPSFVGTLLVQIGTAMDAEFGIEFVPEAKFDATDVASAEEAAVISGKLGLFESMGLQLVIGLPKDVKGGLGFMACRLFESGDIRSYRMDHPVMGFYAAFLNAKWSDEMLTGAMRVRYNYLTTYRHAIQLLVEA